jgi:putative oxidoreductase
MKIAKNLLIGLLAIQFIAIGVMKVVMPLFGVDMFVKNMEGLNYGYAWTVFIGALDLTGGIGLLFKKWRGYAALGLIFLMMGAIGSHVTHNDTVGSIVGGAAMSATLLIVLLLLDKPFSFHDKARNQTFFADAK